jgi:hypothetical protein
MKQGEISRSELSDDLEKIFSVMSNFFDVSSSTGETDWLVAGMDEAELTGLIDNLYDLLFKFAEKYAEDNFFDR